MPNAAGAPDEWLDDQVELYLDGELTGPERAAFERWLAADARWTEALRRARKVRDGLRALPTPACPPGVAQHVFDQVRGEAALLPAADRPARERARFRFWTQVMRPSLAMAMLAALIIVAAVIGRVQQAPRAADPEVTAALHEVQWTLAYLSNLGRGTGQTVREEVLEDHIVLPMQEALNTIFEEPSK